MNLLLFSALQMSLLGILQLYRRQQASIQKLPKYMIFPNKALTQMVAKKPDSTNALLQINGIGKKRVSMFGEDLLNIIKNNTTTPKKPKVIVQHNKKTHKIKTKATPKQDACPMQNKPMTTSVYILELSDNKVYVGKSINITHRIQQHMSHEGSAFTRAYKPTGKRLPRLGNVEGAGDAAERDETLRYMYKYGIDNVRGWKYTRVTLSPEERLEAEMNIRELFDFCRRCGQPGHFLAHCKSTTDRWGKPLRLKTQKT